MAAIITEKFRVHNAKQFKEDFGESASSTYIFIGRAHPWTVDTSPPTPVNGVSEYVDAWSDMTALKKVGSADVSHGLTRYDWTSGVKYDEYAHDISATNTSSATSATSLFASRFYVMTDEYHVYKCLRTGRDSNGATVNSTVKPTGTSHTTLVETADTGAATGRGYLWKYMYTVTASDTIKFVTNDFIPVKTIGAQTEVDGATGALGTAASDDGSSQWDVENAAVDGGVHHAVVTAQGSGYENGDGAYENVPIVGDGSGGVCTVHVAGQKVTHITVTNPGTGYRNAQIIISTSTSGLSGIGSGSGAVVKCIISPQTGHGADPIQELGGNHVIVNSRLEFGEGSGDFPTDNDFRRIGLIQDPFSSGTTVATASSMAAYHQMTVSDAGDLNVDDIIRSSGSDGAGVANSRIVSINGNVVSHIPIASSAGTFTNFAATNNVFLGNSNKGTVSSVNAAYPEVVKHSGQIMYVENRGAVTRAADQIEDIKLIIEM
tara:strand:- start:5657 stop:7126 length:1470 start_codon:yes stop_codon:yes gene_type:complete